MSNRSRSPEIKSASKQQSPKSSAKTDNPSSLKSSHVTNVPKQDNNKTLLKEFIDKLQNEKTQSHLINTNNANSSRKSVFIYNMPFRIENSNENEQPTIQIKLKKTNNTNNTNNSFVHVKFINMPKYFILESFTIIPDKTNEKIDVLFRSKTPSTFSSKIYETMKKTTHKTLQTGDINKSQEEFYYKSLLASLFYTTQIIEQHNDDKLKFINEFYFGLLQGKPHQRKNFNDVFNLEFENFSDFDKNMLFAIFVSVSQTLKHINKDSGYKRIDKYTKNKKTKNSTFSSYVEDSKKNLQYYLRTK